MTVRRPSPTLVLGTAALALLATSAVAQDGAPDPNVGVRERPRPELDPLGIRAGAFIISPRLTLSAEYDDNVFATEDDEEDDIVGIVAPRVGVASNWSRHRLAFGAGAEIAAHDEFDNEDYEDWFVSTDGRLDVTRNAAITAGLGYFDRHEERDDPDDPGGAELVEFDEIEGTLGGGYRINRVGFGLRFEGKALDYDDVGAIDQDFRDRVEYDFIGRVSYSVSPRIDGFVEAVYGINDYDDEVLVDGEEVSQDSQSIEGRLGVGIDITALLFGEVFVGYEFETFDEDDVFDDQDAITFGGGLTWNPTQLTTVRLDLAQGFDETAVDTTGGSTNLETSVGVGVDHELLRNLILSARLGYERDEFEETERVDDTFLAGVGADYFVNRYLVVGADYIFEDRTSDLDAEEFTRNRVRISITGRL